MEKKEYNCTECGTSNFITLLGSKEVVFKKKCNSCQIELEMTLDENEKLNIKPIEKKEKGLNKKKRFRIDDIEIDIEEGISKIKKEGDKRIPSDYPIYEEEINGENRELLGEVKESERTDIKFQTSNNTATVIIAVMILISGILTLSNAWAISQMEYEEGNETPISVIVIDSA